MSEISEEQAREAIKDARRGMFYCGPTKYITAAEKVVDWAKQELSRREAERAEREKLLGDLVQIFDAADQERLKEVYERDAEAEKWKSEGDMYGWNFHKGMASGCTLASIIFLRVKRAIEKHLDLLLALRGVERENRQ